MDAEQDLVEAGSTLVSRRLQELGERPLGVAEQRAWADQLLEVAEIPELDDPIARNIREERAATRRRRAAVRVPRDAAQRSRWALAKRLATRNLASAWGQSLEPVEEVASLVGSAGLDEPAFRVQQFRRARLPSGRPLAPESIRDWVADAISSDGPPVRVATFAVDDDGNAVGDALHSEHLRLTIGYRSGGQWHQLPVMVQPGGILDELRVLCADLCQQFRWDEGWAAAFVLAEALPEVGWLRTGVRQAFNGAWVEVSADVDLTPEEVANAFRAARDRYLSNGARRRSKILSEDSLNLVIWCEQRPTLSDKALWEAALGDPAVRASALPDRRAFQRRVRNATTRVLFGPL